MKKFILKMPTTEADGDNGLNDGNIETYKNSPMLSLTKEELQNSTDAVREDINLFSPEPIEVEFDGFEIEPKDLPDIDHILEVYQQDREYWNDTLKNDKKTEKFFNNAISLLTSPKIRCLRISDYNTTGLTGIYSEKSSPWRNLVKNRGVSDKKDKNGGSFGIGKDASFACSKLRMVFYSTINIDGEKATQGILKLPSYKYNKENFEGYGYFCNNYDHENNPVYECISLEPNYTRQKEGMDKYIVGLDNKIDKIKLKNEIVVASINNFLYAFWSNRLVVRFNDILINKDELENLFVTYAKDENLYDTTKEYYDTLKNPSCTFSIDVIEKDDVKIYIKLDSNYSRKAAIIRQSGMKVFDKNHISGTIGFASVIVLTGDKVNGCFKKIENAEHNQWAIERAEDISMVKAYQNKIFDSLRNKIDELHNNDYETTMDSDGMNEYLPYAYVTGTKKRIEGLSNEMETPAVSIKRKKEKTKASQEETKVGILEGGEEQIIQAGHDFGTGTQSKGTGDGKGETLNGMEYRQDGTFIAQKRIKDSDLDLKLIKSNDYYLLIISSSRYIRSGFIEINVSGEQSAFPINIKEAYLNGQKLKTQNNLIAFENIKNKSTQQFKIILINNEDWALEVSLYESKK